MVITLVNVLMFVQYFLKIRSEVSENFVNCKTVFYQDTPPNLNGFINPAHICQRHRGFGPYFATSYNQVDRIPNFSAYLIDSFDVGGSRSGYWFLEPQLSDRKSALKDIVMDRNQKAYKDSQAMNADYLKSGYTRGHLNPSFYHREHDIARAVTNTLTNVAPQVLDFNNDPWNALEDSLYNAMNETCNFAGARRYFITGVIPSRNTYISNKRVKVPDFFWTATCCDSSDAHNASERMLGWSAAFIGANQINSSIFAYMIEHFLPFLAMKTNSRRAQLFKDYENGDIHIRNCLFSQEKATTVLDEIIQKHERFYKPST